MTEALELYFICSIYQEIASLVNAGQREMHLQIYFGDQLFISCVYYLIPWYAKTPSLAERVFNKSW